MGDTEYIKASTAGDGAAHALFQSNACTDDGGCDVDLDRYVDAGTLEESWTVGGTLGQYTWAITEDVVVSGSTLREFDAAFNVWTSGEEPAGPDELAISDAASSWNWTNDQTIQDVTYVRELQFSALERLGNGTIYGFGAGPVTVTEDEETNTALQSVVRVCKEETMAMPFGSSIVVWWCVDQPVRAIGWTSGSNTTAVNYKDCAGFAEVGGTLFMGCNWYDGLTPENILDATDEDVEDRDIVAYNAELEEWRYHTWISGDGQALKGFTAAGHQLIGVGLKGTLLVSTVTDGVPTDAANVAISGFSEQDLTDFYAVAVHAGRVWVVGSYIVSLGMAGGLQKLILVHADADADLSDGNNWQVKTIQTQSKVCGFDLSNPVACGDIGTDFTFKAVAGASDGLYIFGSWFDGTAADGGQRNRTVWHWPIP